MTVDRDEATAAFLEAALEERLGALSPPDLAAAILAASRTSTACLDHGPGGEPAPAAAARTGRTSWFAAAVLLSGIAVVGGVAIAPRKAGPDRAPAALQEPKPGKVGAMDAAAHFPLALGNRWEYRETCGDASRDVTVQVTARVPVDGAVICQVTTLGAREPAFDFWSADARGVHLHGSDSFLVDPLFLACSVEGLVLPSPIGASAEWVWPTLPPRQMPRGAFGGRHKTPDPIECKATLLRVGEELRLGEQAFSCVHVRVDSELPSGRCVEHLFLARGIGIVRRTSKSGEEPETCRDLVRFTPALPLPDRNRVLASAIGDASKACTWIDLPPTDDAAWTMRSEFAIERLEHGVRCHRLFGDHAVVFDPSNLADFQALALDEDFAPRMEGLFPQRMTVGLARLFARLRAAQLGQRFERDKGMSVEIGADFTKVTLPVSFVAGDGTSAAHEIVVRTSRGIPEAVLFDGK